MALFLSLRFLSQIYERKSGTSSLTHTSYWHYRLFINLGPLAQFMNTFKHANIVAERIENIWRFHFPILCSYFYVILQNLLLRSAVAPHDTKSGPAISCFAMFCYNRWWSISTYMSTLSRWNLIWGMYTFLHSTYTAETCHGTSLLSILERE